MTKKTLIKKLQEEQSNSDVESRHANMDKLLLEYINSPEVTEIYDTTDMWYA